MFLALDAEEAGGTEFVEDTTPEVVEEVAEQAAEPVQETFEANDDYVEAEADPVESEEIIEADPEPSAIDETLAATWKSMGYPEEMLGEFSSNEELRRAMAAQDAMVLSASRQRRTQAAPQQPPVNPGLDPTKAEGQEAPAKLFEKLNLNLEGWDEEAVKAINAINDHYSSALERVEAELRQRDERYSVLENVHVSQAQAAQQQQIDQDNREIDQWFTGLEEGLADTFGVGEFVKLKSDSAEIAARMDLVREAETLREVDAQLGRPPQKWTMLLERALHSRQPHKVKELARKEIAQQVKKRQSQSLARPSSRNGKPSSGVDKAIERNRNFWKRAGHAVPDSDGDDTAESLL